MRPRLSSASGDSTTLFLCGDVMTGRGIDQILPHPSLPHLYEEYVQDARVYRRLAEAVHGPIPVPVDYDYLWGDAIPIWEKMAPELRIVNLETSVTTSEDYWPGKGINYRMHPANLPCLAKARIDVCSLANNHVLDWGYPGLTETLQRLSEAGIKTAGAGKDREEATRPAKLALAGKTVLHLFAFGLPTSGIPADWGAGTQKAGVNLLPDLKGATAQVVASQVRGVKKQGEIVVASLHWGGNWGFEVSTAEREFAHRIIDAGVDVVYGHSSHHVKALEVYHDRLIIYGCGDFINDYEGIGGNHLYRGDLSLMYFVRINTSSGALEDLTLTPMRLRRFRLQCAPERDAVWLRDTLSREGKRFGTSVSFREDGSLILEST